MTYMPTPEQFRGARSLTGLSQQRVSALTRIPQTAISLIENGLKAGRPWSAFRSGPTHRQRLRQFYTQNGIIFPADGSNPVRCHIEYLLADLKNLIRDGVNSKLTNDTHHEGHAPRSALGSAVIG
jgi:hypothetical protein